MKIQRMTSHEYARLSNLTKASITNKELAKWRVEFALRNHEESERIREAWLMKPRYERDAITKAAAPVLTIGWSAAQRMKGGK